MLQPPTERHEVLERGAARRGSFNSDQPRLKFSRMSGKYLLATLGCKVNQYESQQLRDVLESFGLRPVGDAEAADIAVVNTCAVTHSASRKSRQLIRRIARGGRTPVVVVGCGATANAEQLRSLSGVTAVLGHDVDACARLRSLLAGWLGRDDHNDDHNRDGPGAPCSASPPAEEPSRRLSVNGQDVWIRPVDGQPGYDATKPRTADSPLEVIGTSLPVVKTAETLAARITEFAGRQRAFLKVQDGCDAHCTYCIIPSLRPKLRWKPIETAVAEARDLVRAGHQEIIVTGIFLGAYGRDTALRKRWGDRRSPLAVLVESLAGVAGLRRLRLSSLEPGDVDESLLEVLARRENCVPHLHLPLQSGSDGILRRMNRQYNRDDFVKLVDRVQDMLDRPAITTDVIVGFPGETEADFQASVEIARYATFCKIHAFPFSPRDGTAAARWGADYVDPAVVRERMGRLASVGEEMSLEFRRRFIGSTERIIVEHSVGGQDTDATGVAHGRSDRYFAVHWSTDGHDLSAGDLVNVRIDRVTPTRTHGTLLPFESESRPGPMMRTA